ncbi:MAG: hypothetical protein DDT26_01512 [Dehalococcoidia bacterium]|nr:hypothetical protein [Chloroflexota bacterium]
MSDHKGLKSIALATLMAELKSCEPDTSAMEEVFFIVVELFLREYDISQVNKVIEEFLLKLQPDKANFLTDEGFDALL